MENKQMKCIKGVSCLYCGSSYCRFIDELDQLKAENEHLSEKEEEAKHYLEKAEKYFRTLIEIKEICNNNDELQGDFNLVDCDKYKLGKHNLANKILPKISECEVGNAR